MRPRAGHMMMSAGGTSGAGDIDSSELYADMRRRLEVRKAGTGARYNLQLGKLWEGKGGADFWDFELLEVRPLSPTFHVFHVLCPGET